MKSLKRRSRQGWSFSRRTSSTVNLKKIQARVCSVFVKSVPAVRRSHGSVLRTPPFNPRPHELASLGTSSKTEASAKGGVGLKRQVASEQVLGGALEHSDGEGEKRRERKRRRREEERAGGSG
jgi:hypothetical protein